ncbi:acyltransferase family protein [Hymenobacter artigasi]|uniref:Peptidoglycan/LPS O-acetylase OafA/YrhL n=1 Tax=Hymenobacter artigasi TaxID=2719616 RepID=A0ABX1HKJ8_9BACT|nr:acyltransferase [Hymenobacter artigasi]NKI90419.1 peptidoglycan/LPS O-acetylase OafA/YrhL [Hymenobacter artigasi]
MSSPARPLAYRPGLDAVRAVAILLVVVGHWTLPSFPMSLMGSMTFFVLSGYFISGIVWKKEVYVGAPGRWERRLGVFFLRRLIRTLPPYYMSVALGFALPLVTLHQYPGWFLVPVSNLLFYRLQHWGEGVGHYWTMAVDEQFYLLWPVLLAVVPKRTRWLLLVAACGLIFRIAWSTWVRPRLAFALLPGCLDLFAAGAILRHVEQLPVVRRFAHFRWVALSWLAWSALWGILYLTEMHYVWLLIYGSAGCVPAVITLNWAVHQATRPAHEKPVLTALRWVGQRSYGCYLYHLMLPVFYQRAIYHLFAAPETRKLWLAPIPTVMLLLPAMLLLAAASWHWLETPLNHWKNRLAYD